jgi:von Hippel-Lindau disease tumor supressor
MIVAPAAIAGRPHPAELVGLKSVVGAHAQVTFVNHSTQTIRIYWLNYEGQRVLYKTLDPGEQFLVFTYLHHPWLITDADDNAWTIYFPEAQPRRIEITERVVD